MQRVNSVTVQKELEAILSSKGFKNSPILSAFLRFVVEHSLAGKENEIKEYTVGLHVLGKTSDFNPVLDASVRIHAVRLRKLLAEYYQSPLTGIDMQIHLPKGAYKPIFVARSPMDETPSRIAQSTTAGNGYLMARNICVLPFRGFINHEALEFSNDVFSESLSRKLSRFEDISVAGYHELTNQLKQGTALEALVAQFGISYYLTGDIEVDGPDMLVNAQLWDAESNSLVWAHTYPRRLGHGSITDTMDYITRQIVSSLAGYAGFIHYYNYNVKGLGPALTNKKALAVHWFYHFQANQTKEAFFESFAQVKKVVNTGEECALCWAVLADLHIQGIAYQYHTVANPLSEAKAMVARALAIDPNCQQAFVTMAWIHLYLRNREVALQYLDKCDEINPNSTYFKAVCCFGYALAGDYDRCRLFQEQAMELNPLPFAWLAIPGVFMALRQHDFEKMLFHAKKIGATGGIHQYLFELIALFYLNDKVAVAELLDTYLNKYPNGLDHALKTWPAIMLDDELVQQITNALQGLKQLALQDHVTNQAR